MSLPAVSVDVSPGALQGSNYGGHAPIAGSHLFLLEATSGSGGYGNQATSLLSSSVAGASEDLTGSAASNPTYGMYFITTASNGTFNITNDYTCSSGDPVYIYSQGGSPNSSTVTTTAITQAVVVDSGSPNYQKVTFTANQSFVAGEPVTINNFPAGGSYATSVLAAGLSATQFEVKIPTSLNVSDGTYTSVGSVQIISVAGNNPQAVNLAMLGLCPGTSGEFANNLRYIYMNEVSTTAMAYAMAAFATTKTTGVTQNATQIGSPGDAAAVLGLQNAALNANQLYDIQGSTVGASDGDGIDFHIARATTPAGNGTVPQATLDTIGNILAACVDSGNTYNPYAAPATGTQSTQCSTLFSEANSNGGDTATAGTAATDTATAAFNIAHVPAGAADNTTTFMQDVYALQGSTFPFAPNLTAQPNDFTISISFTGGGLGASGGQSPHAVALDNSGNVYTLNYPGSLLCMFSPLGVPLSANGISGNGLNGPASVAIDSGSNYVWVPNYATQSVSRFKLSGTAAGSFSVGETKIQDAEIDGSGDIWVTTNNTNALVKMNNGGTVLDTITTGLILPYSLAIEGGSAGNVWVADETQSEASAYTNAGAVYSTSPFTAGGIDNPTGNAIDASGNIWFGNQNGTVTALTPTGGAVTNSPFATGNTNYSDGIAIDGLGNVWVTNSTGETIYELTNAGTEITPPAGYTTNPATEADGIAIDASGDVWYDSFNTAVLNELVGAAAPVVTPLSHAVALNELGTRP